MFNKDERKKRAIKHTKEMDQKYPSLIDASIKNSIIYRKKDDIKVDKKEMLIAVDPIDSVSAVFKYTRSNRKTAVLNFASYKNPGGGYINGSKAQEECLCEESFLYNVLRSFENTYYTENRKDLNESLYRDAGIYSPNILFMRKNEQRFCDVITVACPNRSAAQKFYDVSVSYNREVLKKRIRFVLNIAAANEVDTLILGAYGCGVFGQDPKEVSRIFKELLEKEFFCFEEVIFAIPEGKDRNLKEFEKTF